MHCKACDSIMTNVHDPREELCLVCLEEAYVAAGIKRPTSEQTIYILCGLSLDTAEVVDVEDENFFEEGD